MLVPETVKGVVHDCHYTAGLDAVHVVLLKYQWPNGLPNLPTILRQSSHTTCAALLHCPGRQS